MGIANIKFTLNKRSHSPRTFILMLHPDRSPIPTTEQLLAACPEFDWTKGSSGQLLDEEVAKRVYALWSQFLQENGDIFKPRAVINDSNM